MAISRLVVILAGVGVFLGVVFLRRKIPLPPLAKSLGSWVMGYVVVLVGCAVWLALEPLPPMGNRDIMIIVEHRSLALFLVAGVVLHFALGWAGARVNPALLAYRSILLGIVAGLFGVLSLLIGREAAP